VKKLAIISLVALCGCAWFQKHEEEIGKISAAVACAIQKEEFDDEAANEACDKLLGNLTPEQEKQVHDRVARLDAKRVPRVVKAPAHAPACAKDGGA
jgi:hypothetical protein